jgi:L-alanine-DL-glutamate epimerase-like enolase superfamily enzyme
MPHPSDVRVQEAVVTFSDERLSTPLRLSKGVIDAITYAEVRLTVVNRRGQAATGIGAILLSDVWAFPHAMLDHATKDAALRALCQELARRLPAEDAASDPLVKHDPWEAVLAQAVAAVEVARGWPAGTLPRLAAAVCLSPFDAALHDGWAKATAAPAYALYTADYLNADLSAHLGPTFRSRYPADYLPARRARLRIQHVVGVGDPLTPDVGSGDNDLVSWTRRDGLSVFKIKTQGRDPAVDAQRTADIYAVAQAAQPSTPIAISVDPNEGCPDAAFLVEMLDRLQRDAPAAYAALDYIEQPTARDLAAYDFTLHAVAARKPVIMDESFDALTVLPWVDEQGWSGVALKTCKGQSAALLAYCWGKQRGRYLTLQDLTNPGLALVHSANLCAQLALSVDYFEGNNRQYMPAARPAERAAYPDYFRAVAGSLHLPDSQGPGLY